MVCMYHIAYIIYDMYIIDDEMSIQSSTYDSHMPTGSRCVGTEKPPLPVDAGTAGGDAGADILELTGLLQSQVVPA